MDLLPKSRLKFFLNIQNKVNMEFGAWRRCIPIGTFCKPKIFLYKKLFLLHSFFLCFLASWSIAWSCSWSVNLVLRELFFNFPSIICFFPFFSFFLHMFCLCLVVSLTTLTLYTLIVTSLPSNHCFATLLPWLLLHCFDRCLVVLVILGFATSLFLSFPCLLP